MSKRRQIHRWMIGGHSTTPTPTGGRYRDRTTAPTANESANKSCIPMFKCEFWFVSTAFIGIFKNDMVFGSSETSRENRHLTSGGGKAGDTWWLWRRLLCGEASQLWRCSYGSPTNNPGWVPSTRISLSYTTDLQLGALRRLHVLLTINHSFLPQTDFFLYAVASRIDSINSADSELCRPWENYVMRKETYSRRAPELKKIHEVDFGCKLGWEIDIWKFEVVG